MHPSPYVSNITRTAFAGQGGGEGQPEGDPRHCRRHQTGTPSELCKQSAQWKFGSQRALRYWAWIVDTQNGRFDLGLERERKEGVCFASRNRC